MGKRGYVSLFSSAGVGCYGFDLEGFDCIVTSELIERRIKIQKYNNVCSLENGYILGDITDPEINKRITSQISAWKETYNESEVEVLIATPPCQGISVANHKKNNELKRNSLVVESLRIIRQISPKFFVIENVRGFLGTPCTDVDGTNKTIKEAITNNLAGHYNIAHRVMNFKDYGNNSSRTRTVIIGIRKDMQELSPYDLFPKEKNAPTLRELIGDFPRLKNMGEINPDDIYHSFRPYDKRMLNWIINTKEGQSAFDNEKPENRPHKIVDGDIIENQNKNGDKYTRCFWDRVAPCVHTRNDILASQSTIHPEDPRVFSIRELMAFMGIPNSFKWSRLDTDTLNSLSDEDKKEFLKKNEINIRQCLGEAVPTPIFQEIARNIVAYEERESLSLNKIKRLIEKKQLSNIDNLLAYLRDSRPDFTTASKIAELANSKRLDEAAYYTRQDLCFSLVSALPDFENKKQIRILEPSVGVGNFLPTLFAKYKDIPEVKLDLLDINQNSIRILKQIIKCLKVPKNFEIRFINDDFLTHEFRKRYDVIVGNPPFGKLQASQMHNYISEGFKTEISTKNLFALFFERALSLSAVVALFTPKSLLNAPEFTPLRSLLETKALLSINDYGEKGFQGVKIETISTVVDSREQPSRTSVNSYILSTYKTYDQNYITDRNYPYWLIYRDNYFDSIVAKLDLGVFDVLRDRTLTSKVMKPNGSVRVIKSRNVGDGVISSRDEDRFVDSPNVSPIAKEYFNKDNIVVAPNLSYYPRASLLPKDSIVDGSAAILIPRNKRAITNEDLAFFSSKEFFMFYRIARNYSTRSLNIDSKSVFFWALPHKAIEYELMPEENRSNYLFALPATFVADTV
jgi:DNA (cytosine-5-)-methyltransferase